MQPTGNLVRSSLSAPPAHPGGPGPAPPAAAAVGRGKWAICRGVLARLEAGSLALRSLSARVTAAFEHRQRAQDQRRLDGLARLLRENYQLDAAPVRVRLTELNARIGQPDFRAGYQALHRDLRADVRASAGGREVFETAVHQTVDRLMTQARQAMGASGPSREGRVTVLADIKERRFNPFLAQRLAEAIRVGRLFQGNLPEFEEQVRETAARLLRENKASVAGFTVTEGVRHKALLETAVGEALESFRPEGGLLIPDEKAFHTQLEAALRIQAGRLAQDLALAGRSSQTYRQAFENFDALAAKAGGPDFAVAYNALAGIVELAREELRLARSAGESSGTPT